MSTLKMFSPTVLTRKGDKNTSEDLTEIWKYDDTRNKWFLEATTVFSSVEYRAQLLERYQRNNATMLVVYYLVEPGEERPSDTEYPFEVGEVVFLRENGWNTFLTIKKKLEGGKCVCNITNSQNPGFMVTYHCYKFQNAQEFISDKIRTLDEERENYSKLSERFSILQQNPNV